MRRVFTLFAVGAIVAIFAVPASADHGGIHPTFRTEETFFHCSGPTKVSNVNNLGQGQSGGLDNPAPWETNPPTESVQEGAGCGALDPGVIRNGGMWDAYFKGRLPGNLRDLTLRVHNLLLSQTRDTDTLSVKISSMVIDGVTVIDNLAVPAETVLSDGNGEEEREITIFLDTDPNTVQSAWVWDTTEVPSGIVFNPEELAEAKIPATA